MTYVPRCTMPMFPYGNYPVIGEQDFDVIVYGARASDLMTISNVVVRSVAKRFPDYQSSMFLVNDLDTPWIREKDLTPTQPEPKMRRTK